MPQQTTEHSRMTDRQEQRTGYRLLFSLPGTRAFTTGNLIARLPMGMFGVSAVVMIAASRGSYALAGAVTATGLAATGVAGPWIARLVDRHGQARVAVPATLTAALGSLALLLCVRYGAPDWTLFAAYAATAATPNIGGLSRARWAHLLREDPGALHTANSFEQAADELCFMLGPVLASFLTGTFFPEAGTLAGAALLLAGMLLFTAQRATEPPPQPRSKAPSPLRSPGIPPLLACFVATGAVFGSMEVVTIAYADAQGHRAAAGAVLALQAAGSCAAGLLYGALRPAGLRLAQCLPAMAVLMALPWLAAARGPGGCPAGGGHGDRADDGDRDDPGAGAHPGRPAQRGHEPGRHRPADRRRVRLGAFAAPAAAAAVALLINSAAQAVRSRSRRFAGSPAR